MSKSALAWLINLIRLRQSLVGVAAETKKRLRVKPKFEKFLLFNFQRKTASGSPRLDLILVQKIRPEVYGTLLNLDLNLIWLSVIPSCKILRSNIN